MDKDNTIEDFLQEESENNLKANIENNILDINKQILQKEQNKQQDKIYEQDEIKREKQNDFSFNSQLQFEQLGIKQNKDDSLLDIELNKRKSNADYAYQKELEEIEFQKRQALDNSVTGAFFGDKTNSDPLLGLKLAAKGASLSDVMLADIEEKQNIKLKEDLSKFQAKQKYDKAMFQLQTEKIAHELRQQVDFESLKSQIKRDEEALLRAYRASENFSLSHQNRIAQALEGMKASPERSFLSNSSIDIFQSGLAKAGDNLLSGIGSVFGSEEFNTFRDLLDEEGVTASLNASVFGDSFDRLLNSSSITELIAGSAPEITIFAAESLAVAALVSASGGLASGAGLARLGTRATQIINKLENQAKLSTALGKTDEAQKALALATTLGRGISDPRVLSVVGGTLLDSLRSSAMLASERAEKTGEEFNITGQDRLAGIAYSGLNTLGLLGSAGVGYKALQSAKNVLGGGARASAIRQAGASAGLGIGIGIGSEASTEVIQTYIEQLAKEGYNLPNLTWLLSTDDPLLQDKKRELIDSAVAGGALGGLLAGAGSVAGGVIKRRNTLNKEQQAILNSESSMPLDSDIETVREANVQREKNFHSNVEKAIKAEEEEKHLLDGEELKGSILKIGSHNINVENKQILKRKDEIVTLDKNGKRETFDIKNQQVHLDGEAIYDKKQDRDIINTLYKPTKQLTPENLMDRLSKDETLSNTDIDNSNLKDEVKKDLKEADSVNKKMEILTQPTEKIIKPIKKASNKVKTAGKKAISSAFNLSQDIKDSITPNNVNKNLRNISNEEYLKLGSNVFKSLDNLYKKEKAGEVSKGNYALFSNVINRMINDDKALPILKEILNDESKLKNFSEKIEKGNIRELGESLVSDKVKISEEYVKSTIDEIITSGTMIKGVEFDIDKNTKTSETINKLQKAFKENPTDIKVAKTIKLLQTLIWNNIISKDINKGGNVRILDNEIISLVDGLDNKYDIDKLNLLNTIELLLTSNKKEIDVDKDNLKSFNLNVSLSKKIKSKMTMFSLMNNEYVKALENKNESAYKDLKFRLQSEAVEIIDTIKESFNQIKANENNLNSIEKESLIKELLKARDIIKSYTDNISSAKDSIETYGKLKGKSVLSNIIDSIVGLLNRLKNIFITNDISNYIINATDEETKFNRIRNVYLGFKTTVDSLDSILNETNPIFKNLNYDIYINGNNGDMLKVDFDKYIEATSITNNLFSYSDKNLKDAFVDYVYINAGKSDDSLNSLADFLDIPTEQRDEFKSTFAYIRKDEKDTFGKVNIQGYKNAKKLLDIYPLDYVFYNTHKKVIFDVLPIVTSSILKHIVKNADNRIANQALTKESVINDLERTFGENYLETLGLTLNDIIVMMSISSNMITNTITDNNGKPSFSSIYTYESVINKMNSSKGEEYLKEFGEIISNSKNPQERIKKILDYLIKNKMAYNKATNKEGQKLSVEVLSKSKYTQDLTKALEIAEENITYSDFFNILNHANKLLKNYPKADSGAITAFIMEDNIRDSFLFQKIRNDEFNNNKPKEATLTTKLDPAYKERGYLKIDTETLDSMLEINNLKEYLQKGEYELIDKEQYLALKQQFDKNVNKSDFKEYKNNTLLNKNNPYLLIPIKIPKESKEGELTFETKYIYDMEMPTKLGEIPDKLDKLKITLPNDLERVLTSIANEAKDIGEVISLGIIRLGGNEKAKDMVFNGFAPRFLVQQSGRLSNDLSVFNGLTNKYMRSLYRNVPPNKRGQSITHIIDVKKQMNSKDNEDYANLLGVFADSLELDLTKPTNRKIIKEVLGENKVLDSDNENITKYNTWIIPYKRDNYEFVTLDYIIESLIYGKDLDLNKQIISEWEKHSKHIISKETAQPNANNLLKYVNKENNILNNEIDLKRFKIEVDGSNTGIFETTLHLDIFPSAVIDVITNPESKLMVNLARSLEYKNLQEKLDAIGKGDVYIKVANQFRNTISSLPDDNPLVFALKRKLNNNDISVFKAIREIGKKLLMTPSYGAGLKDVFDKTDSKKFYPSLIEEFKKEVMQANESEGIGEFPLLNTLKKEFGKSNNPSADERVIENNLGLDSKSFQQFEALGLYIDYKALQNEGLEITNKNVDVLLQLRDIANSTPRSKYNKEEKAFCGLTNKEFLDNVFKALKTNEQKAIFKYAVNADIINVANGWKDGGGFIEKAFGDLKPIIELNKELTKIWQTQIKSLSSRVMGKIIEKRIGHIPLDLNEGLKEVKKLGHNLTDIYSQWSKELKEILDKTYNIVSPTLDDPNSIAYKGREVTFKSTKANSSLEGSSKINQMLKEIFGNIDTTIKVNATSNISHDGAPQLSNFGTFLDYTWSPVKVAPLLNHMIEANVIDIMVDNIPEIDLTVFDGIISTGDLASKTASYWNNMFGKIRDTNDFNLFQLATSFLKQSNEEFDKKYEVNSGYLNEERDKLRTGLRNIAKNIPIYTKVSTENILTPIPNKEHNPFYSKKEINSNLNKIVENSTFQLLKNEIVNPLDFKYLNSDEEINDYHILNDRLSVATKELPSAFTEENTILVDLYSNDKLRTLDELTTVVANTKPNSEPYKIVLVNNKGSKEADNLAIRVAQNSNLKRKTLTIPNDITINVSERMIVKDAPAGLLGIQYKDDVVYANNIDGKLVIVGKAKADKDAKYIKFDVPKENLNGTFLNKLKNRFDYESENTMQTLVLENVEPDDTYTIFNILKGSVKVNDNTEKIVESEPKEENNPQPKVVPQIKPKSEIERLKDNEEKLLNIINNLTSEIEALRKEISELKNNKVNENQKQEQEQEVVNNETETNNETEKIEDTQSTGIKKSYSHKRGSSIYKYKIYNGSKYYEMILNINNDELIFNTNDKEVNEWIEEHSILSYEKAITNFLRGYFTQFENNYKLRNSLKRFFENKRKEESIKENKKENDVALEIENSVEDLNIDIKEILNTTQEVSLDFITSKLDDFYNTNDKHLNELGKSLLKNIISNLPKDLKIKIGTLPDGVNGLYTIDNGVPTIIVDSNADNKTIIHELIHASTKRALINPKMSKFTKNNINEIIRIKKYIQNKILNDREFAKQIGIEKGSKIYDEIFINDIDIIAEFMAYMLSDKNRLSVLNNIDKREVLAYERSQIEKPKNFISKAISIGKILLSNLLNILSIARINNELFSLDLGTMLVKQTEKISDYNIDDKVDTYIRSRIRNVYDKTEALASGALKGTFRIIFPEEKSFIKKNNLTEEQWKVLREKAYVNSIDLGRKYKYFSPLVALARGDLINPITRNAYISVFKQTILSHDNIVGRELSRLANNLRIRIDGSDADLSAKAAESILGSINVAQTDKENSSSSARLAVNDILDKYAKDTISDLKNKDSELYKQVDSIESNYLKGLTPEQKFRNSLGFISTIGLDDLVSKDIKEKDNLFDMALNALKTKNTEAIGREYSKLAKEIEKLIKDTYSDSIGFKKNKDKVLNVLLNSGRVLGRSRMTKEYNSLSLKNVEGMLHMLNIADINREIIQYSNNEETSYEYDEIIEKSKKLVALGSILEYGSSKFYESDIGMNSLDGFIKVLDTSLNEFKNSSSKNLIRSLSHSFSEIIDGCKIRKIKQIVGNTEKDFRFEDSKILDLATSYLDSYTPFEWNDKVHLISLLDNQDIEYYKTELGDDSINSKDELFNNLIELGYKIVLANGTEFNSYAEYISKVGKGKENIIHFRYEGDELLKETYQVQSRIGVNTHNKGMVFSLSNENIRDEDKKSLEFAISEKDDEIEKIKNTSYKEYIKEYHQYHTYNNSGRMVAFDSRSTNKGRIALDRISHFNLSKVSYDIGDIISAGASNRSKVNYEGRLNQELSSALLEDTIRMNNLDKNNLDKNNYIKVFDLADDMRNIPERLQNIFSEYQKLSFRHILNKYNDNNEKSISSLYIRKEVFEMLFGKEDKSFYGYASKLLNRKDPKTKKLLDRVEKGLKELTTEYKNNIILRTPDVIQANFVGNITSTILGGVSIDRALSSIHPISQAIEEYYKDMKEYSSLVIKFNSLSDKDKNKPKVLNDIKILTNKIKKNRVFEPMLRGLDSNIVDDLSLDNKKNDTIFDELNLKALDKISDTLNLSEEVKDNFKTIMKNLTLAPNSEIMQVSRQITRMSDLIPKILIYEQKLSEGLNQKEAIEFSRNFLVDYNIPLTSTILTGVERLGLGFFIKWVAGIQRIAVKGFIDKPITSTLMILLESVFKFGTIPNELLLFRNLPIFNFNMSNLFRWNGVL